jgi:MoxR-like ATPase
VRRELRSRGIVASDRRWAQSVDVLRAHAYLAGRDAVADEDVAFLEHVLWRDPAEHAQVRTVIRELLRGYEDEVRVLLYQSRELHEYALRAWDTRELQSRAAVEAHTKIRNILDKVDLLVAQAESGGRPVERALALRREIADLERDVLGRL